MNSQGECHTRSDIALMGLDAGYTTGIELPKSEGLLDSPFDYISYPSLQPKQISHTTVEISEDLFELNSPIDTTTPKPVCWDGNIRWAIKGPSVFDDEQEELEAVVRYTNQIARRPPSDIWILQYGLRYMPAKGDNNAYRTVKVELPSSAITTNQILSQICIEIYSIILLNTFQLTGSNTAIITFIRQTDAISFLKSTKSGLRIGYHMARVLPVNTPTYPVSLEMNRRICRDGYTRCLMVCNQRTTVKDEVQRILRKSACRSYIEEIEEGCMMGQVYIRFHSIKMAALAFEILKRHPDFGFRGCKIRFLKSTMATAVRTFSGDEM
ncbi:hypothetical protein PHISCL_01033 [Aspergillus sclerotialis]|uniref:RRM domain-containing protein n=1 Tax=Aspergillus sclerotialis TaxID=2070753 RepID=A0A3A2ZTX8_9EURO|nr:hypothetical protein PHISCL_01033 [Aspergillus sclerotialis]